MGIFRVKDACSLRLEQHCTSEVIRNLNVLFGSGVYKMIAVERLNHGDLKGVKDNSRYLGAVSIVPELVWEPGDSAKF